MSSICTSSIDASKEVKKWLTKQPEVKEESLTDWLLYTLSEKNPIIHYKTFTRSEEGRKTGADWEWWFVFPSDKSFAARIQAKKLKPSADCYPSIAYANNNKLQIERLLEDSRNDKMPAFYAFYSAEESLNKACTNEGNEGFFIAEANKIYENVIMTGRKKLFPNDVLKFGFAISCLFCCADFNLGRREIEQVFHMYLQQLFNLQSSNPVEDNNLFELGFRNTPDSILQIVNFEDVNINWEKEHGAGFLNTNALLVFDLRDSTEYSNTVLDKINKRRKEDAKNPETFKGI